MATRRPIVLVSGAQSELPVGDNIDGALYQGQQVVAGSGLVGGGLFTTNPRLDVGLATNPSGLYFAPGNKLGFDGRGDSVQVIASGTGAVYRTIQNKSRDIVSVKDFGAKGDGVTDDTLAFQAALTAVKNSGGGTLLIPSSSQAYIINQASVISVDFTGLSLTLIGEGAVLDATGISPSLSADVIRIAGGSGTRLSFTGFTLLGQNTDAAGSLNGLRVLGCDHLYLDGLNIDGFSNYNFVAAPLAGDTPAVTVLGSIKNCDFTNGGYSNCYVNSNNTVIENNYFDGAGRASLGVTQGYGLIVAGYYNTVSNNTSNNNRRYGIDVRNTANVVVTNNNIYNSYFAGIYGVNESSVKKFRNAKILNNLVNNNGNPNSYGIWVGQYATSSTIPTEDLLISGNIVRNCSDYYGILVSCDYFSSAAALNRLIISNNIIENNVNLLQGIRVDNSATGEIQDVLITNNSLYDSGYMAIYNCKNVIVANNIIRISTALTLTYGIVVSRQWGTGQTAKVYSNILTTAGTFTNSVVVSQFSKYYQDNNYLNGTEISRTYSNAPSLLASSLGVTPTTYNGKRTFSLFTGAASATIDLATIQLPDTDDSVYAVVNLYSSRYSNVGKADYILRISARNASGTIEIKASTVTTTTYEAGITAPNISISSTGTTLTLTVTQNGTYTASYGEAVITSYSGSFVFI